LLLLLGDACQPHSALLDVAKKPSPAACTPTSPRVKRELTEPCQQWEPEVDVLVTVHKLEVWASVVVVMVVMMM
jgi:hypothetical protein